MTTLPHTMGLRLYHRSDELLSLAGDLDLASAPQLRAAAHHKLATGARQLILDLTDLRFCDCAGLNVLLWAEHTFPDGVLLHHPNPQLRTILRTTELDQALTID